MSTPSSAAVPPADSAAPAHRYTAALADAIETRWQQTWADRQTFRMPNPGQPGFDASRPKFYCLDMFPYPSGAGLHVGHPEGYTATDILCRYKRHKGFNVLHPMGWDAFGLPAEQYAIQTGVHPAKTTRQSIDTFRRQLQRFGFCYDWSREVGTIDPEYYRWTQWIFLQIYDAWFDASTAPGRARPIAELVAQFQSGARPVRFNPGATEVSDADKARDLGPWSALDPRTRQAVINSYRLAYQGTTTVNWCPALGTVLANDEVIDGRSERGGHPVLRKPLSQWMFRITTYADRLIEQLDTLHWPESTKTMQREWIGRSQGAEIDFEVVGTQSTLTVFTTRPDTLFGATYMVVAPEHPLCRAVIDGRHGVTDATRTALAAYVTTSANRSDVDRQEAKTKTGVFTGLHATNPATGTPIPIWTADYVLMGYGTGAIMAVPAHDERDYEFAEAFTLPIVQVVRDPNAKESAKAPDCFDGLGIACNSSGPDLTIDGLPTVEAKAKVIAWLESRGIGRSRVNYKFRDWTFSRQRYWGEPFPIVFDDAGQHYPVSAQALPVALPDLPDYRPVESDDPQPLLAKATSWVRTTAGAAGVDPSILPPGTPVTRETNTMPGSAGSSWYFLRYCDPTNARAPIDRHVDAYWMNVDFYMGGSEHTVGHLLYSRFWQNVLHDLGHVAKAEPFQRLFHQGMITSFAYERADKSLVAVDMVDEQPDGTFVERATGQRVKQIVAKMSKSLKNVVNPDDIIRDYGADTFRLYEMYMGPLEASKPWNTKDIIGPHRFLQRLWRNVIDEETSAVHIADAAPSPELTKLLHRTIAGVTADIDNIALHTAIAKLIELNNALTRHVAEAPAPRAVIEPMLILLSPFCPHIAEELWQRIGPGTAVGSHPGITDQPWPTFDPALLIDDSVEIAVQVLGKVRGKLIVPTKADAKAIEALALADPGVQAHLAGKSVKKCIVVPGRLVNFVI